MSISSLLTIGSRAMTANYAALQTTGNNVANANTAGYSRQSVELATAFSQQTGSGFFGKGVDVATVSRAHSDFLTREAATTASLAAADQARSGQLQQLESVFQTGEAGLGYSAQQMFNAFVDVSNKPQDASARQVALARVGDLATRFRTASDQLDSIQSGISQDLRTAVSSINALTTRIADLNQRIANAKGTGHEPNDLLDQRDTAIADLSKIAQVTTVGAADGTVGVFLGGGQKLVLGAESTPLTALADPYDPAKVQVGITEGGTTRAFPDGFIAGGSVAGLLRVQNHDLGDARGLLGQLASAIAGSLNAQQALGLDLGQPSGPGAPLLAVGAASVAPSSNNAKVGGVPVASYVNGLGARVSSVSITVVSTSELQPSDYELVADPALAAGSYRLTRLSDGTAQTVSNGSVVDGFRIDIAAPAPAARDRFLLQPVAPATRSIVRALDDPKGIAAASPVNATMPASNTGTATVASLAAVSASINPNLTATITFTDNSGNFSYSLVDTTSVLPTVNGTGSLVAGQPVSLNGFALNLNGIPKLGDSVSVAKTAYPAGDNGNANALLALRDATFVGQKTISPGVVAPGVNVTDAYASALASIGVRVQSASAAADQSAAIASDAKTAEAEKSGVNLDEEAARLIQYQQSYQAAAKMLQIAQSVFDTLLQIGK
ncbi:MAG TPA: flagellar hook-associated protein FlgK [Caldimonas sp.]|nr:flagellar hook-associated protein FlgK [Caldimonas sp.]HEV7575689.1 flagellar hook-associated protein FlgK [Caldimonas sp.]